MSMKRKRLISITMSRVTDKIMKNISHIQNEHKKYFAIPHNTIKRSEECYDGPSATIL